LDDQNEKKDRYLGKNKELENTLRNLRDDQILKNNEIFKQKSDINSKNDQILGF
jgi:hypothetical protein